MKDKKLHAEMWAEGYLNGIKSCQKWIDIYNMRLAEIADTMISYGGGIQADKVQTSPKGDALERRVIDGLERYGKIQEDILKRREELWARQDEAMERIMTLKDGNRKNFLLLHYIDGLTLTEVAMNLGHTEPSRIYHLKDEALRYFDQVGHAKGWHKKK